MLSDLNDEGQALVQSGADDRWIASFDKPGNTKPPSDLSSLKIELDSIRLKRNKSKVNRKKFL